MQTLAALRCWDSASPMTLKRLRALAARLEQVLPDSCALHSFERILVAHTHNYSQNPCGADLMLLQCALMVLGNAMKQVLERPQVVKDRLAAKDVAAFAKQLARVAGGGAAEPLSEEELRAMLQVCPAPLHQRVQASQSCGSGHGPSAPNTLLCDGWCLLEVSGSARKQWQSA